MEKNRTNGEETVLAGPAREGLALLQGLLLCGHCGRRLTVRYTGNGGIYPRYQCNWLRRESLGTSKECLNLRCDLLDAAVAEEVLKAMQPAELELALAALAELESRDQALGRRAAHLACGLTVDLRHHALGRAAVVAAVGAVAHIFLRPHHLTLTIDVGRRRGAPKRGLVFRFELVAEIE